MCLHYNEFCIHSAKLNDLYSSPNFVPLIEWRIMRWAGHVARTGKKSVSCTVFVVKPERKRPLGRPRRRSSIILLTSKFMEWDVEA